MFARAVCWRAPYFASISPRIALLEPGRCEAWIAHRRKVTNHIGTVHAIALCNLAEFAGGLMTDVSIPSSMRWIPKGMQVDATDTVQSRRYDLKKLTRLCFPVAESGTPLVLKTGELLLGFTPAALRHETTHLVCYQALPAKKRIAQNGLARICPRMAQGILGECADLRLIVSHRCEISAILVDHPGLLDR